ncbi:hypothetical protein BWI17_20790 [Betaproteobacteria bacterium GR16-43]|nr:hypothetical protein BWI17_20790 [Betaproteobacteria bacterium GR16-43]
MPSVSANGIALEYETLGEPKNPTILLVMGLGANMRLWPSAFCEKLAAAGFHVVRFDNRDAGRSTQLDHLGTPNIAKEALKYLLHLKIRSPYTLDDMAADTVALIDALGLVKPHIVGVSMGGMISQNVAALHPDKVASLTSIMSTTGSRKLPRPERRAYKALISAPPKRGDFEGAVRHLMFLLRVIGSKTNPSPEEELRPFCERHVAQGSNPPGAARQMLAIAAAGDRSKTIAKIRVPTLVLHGAEDPLLRPPCGAHTARVIRDAGGDVKHVVVGGMGHDLPTRLLDLITGHIVDHIHRVPE